MLGARRALLRAFRGVDAEIEGPPFSADIAHQRQPAARAGRAIVDAIVPDLVSPSAMAPDSTE